MAAGEGKQHSQQLAVAHQRGTEAGRGRALYSGIWEEQT